MPVLEAPEGVEVTKRVQADGRVVYFLLNHTERAQRVKLPVEVFMSLLDRKEVEGEVEVSGVDVAVLVQQ